MLPPGTGFAPGQHGYNVPLHATACVSPSSGADEPLPTLAELLWDSVGWLMALQVKVYQPASVH